MNARRLALSALGAGLLVIVILVGGSIGGDETEEPPALRLGEDGMPLGDRPLPAKELPADFVPNLPPVPVLPPGVHVSHGHPTSTDDDERGDDLSAEMRLLSEARDELARDDAASCLTLLDQHRERFPTGALSEDRDAYTILALHALGRSAEVERRYVDFREDYPESTFNDTLARELSHP